MSRLYSRESYSPEIVREYEHKLAKGHHAMLVAAAETVGYAALAARLSLPVGTVKSKLHRARAAIARLIASDKDRETTT